MRRLVVRCLDVSSQCLAKHRSKLLVRQIASRISGVIADPDAVTYRIAMDAQLSPRIEDRKRARQDQSVGNCAGRRRSRDFAQARKLEFPQPPIFPNKRRDERIGGGAQ
jgi:hypothetical protein